MTTPIATKKRAPLRIALHFPHGKPGERAVITLLGEGRIQLPLQERLPGERRKDSNVLTTRLGPSRIVRLRYEFGKALHNQKIEAKVGLGRAILNLHLHDGSDGH